MESRVIHPQNGTKRTYYKDSTLYDKQDNENIHSTDPKSTVLKIKVVLHPRKRMGLSDDILLLDNRVQAGFFEQKARR